MAEKKNKFMYFAAFSVNLMSFVGTVGYAWTSPYIPKLETNSEENPLPRPTTVLENSWIASFFVVGCLFGTIFAGIFDEKLGKKKTLIIFHIPIVISNVMLIFPFSLEEIYIARLLQGIGSGCVFSIIPTYLGEISDKETRGSLSMMLNFTLIFSTIAVVSLGPYISMSAFSIICLIPSILFLLSFGIFTPESPYDLVAKGRMDAAEQYLSKFRDTTDVQKEMIDIVGTVEMKQHNISFKEMFHSKEISRSLVITVGLLFFQEFCGPAAIMAYQQTIFDSTDGIIPGHICVMIVSVAQLLPTIAASYFIDTVGRKKLLIISQVGISTSHVALGTYFYLQTEGYDLSNVSWLPLTCVLTYMVFFRLGLSPVPYTLIGEIFPVDLKAKLSAAAIVNMYIFGLIITAAFPIMFEQLGMAWTFWIFAGFTIISIIFTKLLVPETKGKSFMEIQTMLKEGLY